MPGMVKKSRRSGQGGGGHPGLFDRRVEERRKGLSQVREQRASLLNVVFVSSRSLDAGFMFQDTNNSDLVP